MQYRTAEIPAPDPKAVPVYEPPCPTCGVPMGVAFNIAKCRNAWCGRGVCFCALGPDPYETSVDVWSASTGRVVKRRATFCKACGAEIGLAA